HEKQHTTILHQNLPTGCPDESSALSGRRRGKLRADCIEDLVGRFLDILKTGRQELLIAAVETDVVLRGASRFEPNCAANDECDGLSLSLADALRRVAPALVTVHHFVREFMSQRREFFSRR